MSKKYRDQYTIQPIKTANGFTERIQYTGVYYVTDLPTEKLQKYKSAFIGISVVIALLFVMMGFLNNDGSRVLVIMLPYAILFLPIVFMIISSVSFYRNQGRLTTPIYDKSFKRLKTAGIGILVLSSASVVGDVFYMFSGQGKATVMEMIFVICGMMIAVVAFLSVQIHKKIPFRQIGNPHDEGIPADENRK